MPIVVVPVTLQGIIVGQSSSSRRRSSIGTTGPPRCTQSGRKSIIPRIDAFTYGTIDDAVVVIIRIVIVVIIIIVVASFISKQVHQQG